MLRLVKVAALLPPVSLGHGLPDPNSTDRTVCFLLRTVFPALILLAAAALCRWRRSAPWWRVHVVVACVAAYASLAAADISQDYTSWTVKAEDSNPNPCPSPHPAPTPSPDPDPHPSPQPYS